jgi:hypothetical protein
MNYFERLIVLVALASISTACGDRSGSEIQSAAPVASTSAPPAVPPPAPVLNPVDSLAKTMATDVVNTKVGSIVDGRMTNAGKGGFLLFGPYVSFSAGTYTVSMKGRIEDLPASQKVRIDVASSKGRAGHGHIEVTQPGDLPAFDFTLPEDVGDLEVRVLVPAGSKVTIESYRVERKI